MTSRAHWNVLLCLSFAAGCQSAGAVFPLQANREPSYTMDELAALEGGPQAAARNEMQLSGQQKKTANLSNDSGITQASYTTDSAPVSAQRIDQLVKQGQAGIRAAGHGNSEGLLEARQNFAQVLSLDAANPSAHHGMAIIADLQKDWPAAEFHYKQSLSANPQDPNLLNDLGYSYLLQNRFHEAQQYLNQSLSIAPQHERAHVNYALLSLKRGDRAGAEQRLARIYSPTDAQATLLRLERDLLQEFPANANIAGNNIPDPTSTEGLMYQMQQERDRVASNRSRPAVDPTQQQQQPTADDVPISVYAPGMFDDQNQVGESSQPSFDPRNGMVFPDRNPNAQQTMAQPMLSNQTGVLMLPQTTGVDSNVMNQNGGMTGQPYNSGMPQAAQLPNQNYPNQYQQVQPGLGASQLTNNASGYVPPAQSVSSTQSQGQQYYGQQSQGQQQNTSNGLIQQLQPGSTQNHQYHESHNQYGMQNQAGGMNPNVSASNAPLVGLNAGPGGLFPIVTSAPRNSGQSGSQQMNYPAQPAFPNGGYPNQQQQFNSPANQQSQSMMNSAPVSNGAMFPHVRQTLPADQMIGISSVQPGMSGASQPQMGYNAQTQQPYSTASMPQPQYPGSQTVGYQQPNIGMQVPNSGAVGMSPAQRQPAAGALDAYERQLQSLDNQYNQALRQMDGSGSTFGQGQPQY